MPQKNNSADKEGQKKKKEALAHLHSEKLMSMTTKMANI